MSMYGKKEKGRKNRPHKGGEIMTIRQTAKLICLLHGYGLTLEEIILLLFLMG